jgi:hypothetical protein
MEDVNVLHELNFENQSHHNNYEMILMDDQDEDQVLYHQDVLQLYNVQLIEDELFQ